MKKVVFRNLTKFAENTSATVSFLSKVQASGKRYYGTRCFPVNFVKFLRTLFLRNTSGRLLLYYVSIFLKISIGAVKIMINESFSDNDSSITT